jgi:hypothetical protein
MRPLYQVTNAELFDIAEELGASETFVTLRPGRTDEIDGVYLLVEPGTSKTQLTEMARSALDIWRPGPGERIGIYERDERGGHEVWASDLSTRLARAGLSLAGVWGVAPDEVVGL